MRALARAPAAFTSNSKRHFSSNSGDGEPVSRRQQINLDILGVAKWLLPLAGLISLTLALPEDVTLGRMLGQEVKPEPGFEPERFNNLIEGSRRELQLESHKKAAARAQR